MRVVVTGGGGYVGYHIGWALSRGGHEVTLLDLTPPDPEWTETAPRALWDSLPRGCWGEVPGSLEFVKGSITSLEDLERHFQGAAAVVHSASYGMSGREQLAPHAPQQEKVNVEGTRKVIRAALTAKVRALVYTSTYNVVFGGREISNGDETLPFFPLHAHTDHYSRTKAIAEMLVLMADGKCGLAAIPHTSSSSSSSSSSSCLRTCSLRMNGVMGLGEKKHTQRVISAIRSGLLILAYGRKEGLVDFIGIQNVVQAHVKALTALLEEQRLTAAGNPTDPTILKETMPSKSTQESVVTSTLELPSPVTPSASTSTSESGPCRSSGRKTDPPSVALSPFMSLTSASSVSSNPSPPPPPSVSGQVFFISDSAPVSNFEYFRPLFEGLGYTFPALTLPLWVILAVAHLQEFIYCLVHNFLPFTPLVTPAEAYKSGITHYCSSQKAVEAFGYCPTRPNDLKQILEYYKAQGCHRTHRRGLVSLLPLALVCILPVFLFLIVL